MRPIKPFLTFWLSLLLGARIANPQPMSLTVEDCVRIGLEKSRSLHASQMRVESAEARTGEAGAARRPSIRLAAGYTRLSEVSPFEVSLPLPPPAPSSFVVSPSILDNASSRLTVQQPVFTGLRFETHERIARLGAEATRQEYARDRADLAYGIRAAYWNLFKAIQTHKVIDENVSQVQAHLKDIRSFLAQGMAVENEVLKVQVQLSNVRILQIRARNAVRLATLGLDNLMGLPLETEVLVASSVERRPDAPAGLEDLVRTASANRPELKAMDLRVSAGAAGVTLARSGRMPQAYLVGNYVYARPNPRILPARDRFTGTWDLGVLVSMDLWNGGTTRYQTDQAQAQLRQSQDLLGQLRDAIRLEVTQSYLGLMEAGERAAAAEEGVLQAEENHRVTREKFRAGLSLNSDLLDAEVALLEAKTGYTQTLVDCEIARAGLRRATGKE